MATSKSPFDLAKEHLAYILEYGREVVGPYGIDVLPDGRLGFDKPQQTLNLDAFFMQKWARHQLYRGSGFAHIRCKTLVIGFELTYLNLIGYADIQADVVLNHPGFSNLAVLPPVINGSLNMQNTRVTGFAYSRVEWVRGELNIDGTQIRSLSNMPHGVTKLYARISRLKSLAGLHRNIQEVYLDERFNGSLANLWWLRPTAKVAFDGALSGSSAQVDLFCKYWEDKSKPFGVRRSEYMRVALTEGHVTQHQVLWES